MPLIFDSTSLGTMCEVRRAFDPEGRANPNKVVPVHYCREWAAGARR
jgi:glycolate oxidase